MQNPTSFIQDSKDKVCSFLNFWCLPKLWLRPNRLTWGSEKSVCPQLRFKMPPLSTTVTPIEHADLPLLF